MTVLPVVALSCAKAEKDINVQAQAVAAKVPAEFFFASPRSESGAFILFMLKITRLKILTLLQIISINKIGKQQLQLIVNNFIENY